MPMTSEATRNYSKDQFRHILEDAKELLAFAVEAGVEVDADTAQKIINADKVGGHEWPTGADGGAVLEAVTKLAAQLRPVTAETLRACRDDAHKAIRFYRRISVALGVVLIFFSLATGIENGLTNSINSQMNDANRLILDLHTYMQKGPVEAQIGVLQQLSIASRNICTRANQLNKFFLVDAQKVPTFTTRRQLSESNSMAETGDRDISTVCNIELPRDLNSDMEPKVVASVISEQTAEFQEVRFFALNVTNLTSIIYGAIVASFLPVMYAILGACAAVLRAFTQQIEKRTFTYSYASPARFIIAGIAGGVIGLFNLSIGDGASASPLALAFLVGYATDVFFSILEGSLPTVARSGPTVQTALATQKVSPTTA
jgi:hypothetical protein